ncbi:hemogen isoform X2 [Pipistrellus kuhlii]|uniref:hemogen isoform X2 n=1 Tax=Pipistrellus kuhlii TaxID=59472 RepID=UPI00174F699C|nr:hemogen isoform X2 [Pipistrellus kuhlii]
MDLGKNQPRLALHQTCDSHQENYVPEVIGTWSLRNREQLRKRKAEAQEKQTSQWQFGEKKYKRQKTGKGNQRGRKNHQNTELKVEPQSQLEKEMMENALAPTEKENESPRSVTEALPSVASPKRTEPEKKLPATGQESTICQKNSSEYQETTVQNHPSEIGQDIAEPEDLSPKLCLEIAVIQGHSSKMCHDMAGPEDLSPKMCQEIAVIQGHSSKMCHDIPEPEDLSPKMCQETSVVKALPSKTYEDTAGMEGCSLEVCPKAEVPKGYTLETHQTRAEPKEDSTEPGQGIAGTESFPPKIQQEIAEPKDLSTKAYQERVEPEHVSHKAYEEISVPKALSCKTIQETPAHEECPSEIYIYQKTPEPEDCASEIYQEKQGPEDLSTKIYKNVPVLCFPEPTQEVDGPHGQDPNAHQEDTTDVYTFSREMKEKPKAQEPETPAIPDVPQEINPENDVYSYVLF